MGTGGLRWAGLRTSHVEDVLHVIHQDSFEPGTCLDRGEDTRGGGLLANDVPVRIADIDQKRIAGLQRDRGLVRTVDIAVVEVVRPDIYGDSVSANVRVCAGLANERTVECSLDGTHQDRG